MVIDITHVVRGEMEHKADILKEMLEWLHLNVGEYLAYDADVKKDPYRYAIGKGWKIVIRHEAQPIIKSMNKVWELEISDDALGEMFILKFL
jgi:hypothetical protein